MPITVSEGPFGAPSQSQTGLESTPGQAVNPIVPNPPELPTNPFATPLQPKGPELPSTATQAAPSLESMQNPFPQPEAQNLKPLSLSEMPVPFPQTSPEKQGIQITNLQVEPAPLPQAPTLDQIPQPFHFETPTGNAVEAQRPLGLGGSTPEPSYAPITGTESMPPQPLTLENMPPQPDLSSALGVSEKLKEENSSPEKTLPEKIATPLEILGHTNETLLDPEAQGVFQNDPKLKEGVYEAGIQAMTQSFLRGKPK